MKIGIYSVRDNKADAFMQPLFVNAEGLARRSFGEAVNDPKSVFGKYPGDFDLYKLGAFDDEKGELIPLDKPVNLVNGVALVVPAGSGPVEVR